MADRRRRERDADVQPAPRLPEVRHQLRRAGAAQLLVQLAVRRVRDVRRAGHARSRSTPSWSSPTPTCRSTTGAIAPWRSAHTQYFTRMLEAVAEVVRHRPRRAVANAHRQAAEGHPARRRGQPQGQVQEPLRPHARSTRTAYEGVIPWINRRARRRRERLVARAVRGLHARGAVHGVRRRAPEAGLAGGHGQRPQHRRGLRHGDRRVAPSSSPRSSSASATG